MERLARKKEQQVTHIMNSQSDAIVVVNSDKTDQVSPNLVEESAEPILPNIDPLKILFCNSKSLELFGFDPIGDEASAEDKLFAYKQLKLPQFLPIDRYEEGNKMYDEENPYNIQKLN